VFQGGVRHRPGLREAGVGLHTGGMDDLFTAVGLGLLVSAPWLAAIVLVCRREGLRILFSDGREAFPTQASQLRAFDAR
jgi:hypothetical protein